MSEQQQSSETVENNLPKTGEEGEIDTGGAYEIIRQRLSQQSQRLSDSLNGLNQHRSEVFGSTKMEVIGRTRIRTENNCVPRDIKAFGHEMLFGYNVFVGMRAEINVADVFSLHHIEETAEGFEFAAVDSTHNFLNESKFVDDFNELYRYYKDAKLSQLRDVAGKRLAIFQIGRTLKDIRVFRWTVDARGKVSYIDNRGERDHVYPDSHDFEWQTTTRENHVTGTHPHVSILNEVFVEAVGGDLTVKIENNTEDGLGIYREPVEDLHQSLADAQIQYAKVGALILLKIRPYKETLWRYLVFNPLLEKVQRIDAIGTACIALPEDHGIIFPGGYYLSNGEFKIFPEEHLAEMIFKRRIRAPNGEDVLYVFDQQELGKLVLFSYNLIRKTVDNPIICHGYSIFADGRMVVFRADDDTPTRVHPMQIWQTPYMSAEHAAQSAPADSFLARIGNAELVRGLSDAYGIKHLIDEQSPTRLMYEHLIATTRRVMDGYHWLDHEEVGNLSDIFHQVLENAEQIIDEFEKVQALRKQAAHALSEIQAKHKSLLFEAERYANWHEVSEFVANLGQLRALRGELISLRELRYIDLSALDQLSTAATEAFDTLSQITVKFILAENAFAPYHQALEQQIQDIGAVKKTQEITALAEQLETTANGLELLTEVLNTLKIDDSDARTRILEDIAEVYAKLNRARAELELKRKELSSREASAEFAAQFRLFSQSVSGALSLADTPDKADEQLSRLLVQLEELEGRFGEFDEFLEQISEQRETVYSSFESRKQQLLEARQRRALHLETAANRILQGVTRRLASFASLDEQNAWFASDAMVMKVRDMVQELDALGDSVRAEDLSGKLKTTRDQAGRALRDSQDIFSEGGKLIQLGQHQFSVNTQELDLTLLPKNTENGLQLVMHLSGTDYFDKLENPDLDALRDYWQQSLISENEQIYRAEYLAASIFFTAQQQPELAEALQQALLVEEEMLTLVRKIAAERYEEGYERGVHDVDAAQILRTLLQLNHSAGLLAYAPACRALAQWFWAEHTDREQCQQWQTAAQTLNTLQKTFNHAGESYATRLSQTFAQAIADFVKTHQLQAMFPQAQASHYIQEAHYLLAELQVGGQHFTATAAAMQQVEAFSHYLQEHALLNQFDSTLHALNQRLAEQYILVHAWLSAYQQSNEASSHNAQIIQESCIILLT
ncbi:DNA repair ATPase [Candidatus Venteria ishoeyi]|uniref:ATPase involved in DNA repair n=1 Tax=Candidatus Venteria ishoeyi TaxID=1899563 RepID=A0A1H6FD72_9GAMM|nr:DNA repair ATPase [Candidatus Venteria ishoeyi]SEH07997.1 ATPase involved in DNA repair [Candidatus Venteria ishoeyi]